jgi:hypothetical protein
MTLNTCEDRNSLPSLGFIFKGYTKDGKDEAFELILTPDDYVLEFEVNGNSDCVIGIGSDNEDSGWTLGQVFLRAYYTVFDRESEAIGFVKSNPDPSSDEIEISKVKSVSNQNYIPPVNNLQAIVNKPQISLMNGPLNLYQNRLTSFLK